MTRQWVDCRNFPDDIGCTLYLSGEEEDVVRAVTEHAASAHGEQLTREQIRGMLKDEVEEVGMARA
jgi:predicted small metal-binding protein